MRSVSLRLLFYVEFWIGVGARLPLPLPNGPTEATVPNKVRVASLILTGNCPGAVRLRGPMRARVHDPGVWAGDAVPVFLSRGLPGKPVHPGVLSRTQCAHFVVLLVVRQMQRSSHQ